MRHPCPYLIYRGASPSTGRGVGVSYPRDEGRPVVHQIAVLVVEVAGGEL